jgi:hypothetical protein
LALTSECHEDRAILFAGLTVPKRCGDNVLAEASDSMSLEVRRRPAILGVLITAHPVNALVAATGGGALEEMIFAAVVVADGDFGVKELVNRRAPALFEAR